MISNKELELKPYPMRNSFSPDAATFTAYDEDANAKLLMKITPMGANQDVIVYDENGAEVYRTPFTVKMGRLMDFEKVRFLLVIGTDAEKSESLKQYVKNLEKMAHTTENNN